MNCNVVELRTAISKYGAENGGDVLGLAIAEFNGDHLKGKSSDIFEDMLAWLEMLQRRNATMVNLRKRYVTNEIHLKRGKR